MNHIKLIANALIASAVFMACASANAESKNPSQYEKCMASVDLGAFKNSQWASCSDQEIKRQDVTLNTAYSTLKKSLSAEQKDSLTKAQRSWLKFREDWCRFEEVGPSAPGGEVNYGFCMMALTDKQIDAIKGLQF